MPLTPTLTTELLLSSDFAITRELIRCKDCNSRATLDDARKAADLPVSNVLWEDARQGVKKPVICPRCSNTEYFVRTIVRAIKVQEHVTVQTGTAQVQEVGGDVVCLDEVKVAYACAVEGCDGVVELNREDYVLTEDVG